MHGHAISPGYMLLEQPPWNRYGDPNAFPHDVYAPAFEYQITWAAWYTIANEAWTNGEWPLWNPYQLTGVPLLANYQTAFFYPPHVMYALIDPNIAGTIDILLKIWLAGVTAFVFAWGIGLRGAFAFLVSFAWMLAPMQLFWTYWSPPDTAVWLPLQLLGVEILVVRRMRAGFLLIALSGTLLLLAGHPETAFASSLGAGLYFLLRLIFLRAAPVRAKFSLAAVALSAWFLALAVSAAQLLPFLEYLTNSWTFAERAAVSGSTTAPPVPWMSLLVPQYYGISHGHGESVWKSELGNSNWTATLYLGMCVWLGIAALAVSTITRQRTQYWNARVSCLAAISILFLFLALSGDHYAGLPHLPFSHLILRTWLFPFALFGLIVVAAISLQRWISSAPRLRSAIGIFSVMTLVTTLAWIAYYTQRTGLLPDTVSQVDAAMAQATVVAFAACVTMVLATTSTLKPFAPPLLAGLVVLDLFLISKDVHPTCPRAVLEIQPQLMQHLRERTLEGRVFAADRDSLLPSFPRGMLQHYGVEDLRGHEGLYPYRLQRFYANSNLFGPMWPTFSARYILSSVQFGFEPSPDLASRYKKSAPMDGFAIWEDTAAWPRAKLVGAWKTVSDEAALFAALNDPAFDPAATAIVETELPNPSPTTDQAELGSAQIVARTPNSVTVEVDAASRALLVLTDQYFPGWNAYINGEQTRVVPAYGIFRAVQVEAGKQEIVFRYEPASLRWGLAISICAMLASIVSLLRIDFRKRGSAA